MATKRKKNPQQDQRSGSALHERLLALQTPETTASLEREAAEFSQYEVPLEVLREHLKRDLGEGFSLSEYIMKLRHEARY